MVSSQDHCLFSFYLFIPLYPPHCLQSSFSDTPYHVTALLKTFNGSPPSLVWCPRTSTICLQSIFSAIFPFLPCTLAVLNYLPSANRPFHSLLCLLYIYPLSSTCLPLSPQTWLTLTLPSRPGCIPPPPRSLSCVT